MRPAERWKISSFVLFSFVIATIIYPIYANWTWGGGWLAAMGTNFGLGHGHVDFAGSSVVHMTGGVMALVLAKMIGPRIGKYGPDGRVNPIAPPEHPAGHDRHVHPGLRLVRLQRGVDPLRRWTAAWRWSPRTRCSPAPRERFSAFVYVKVRYGKADPSWLANGMLAGLVAITAPCAFVSSWAAMLIGAIAGVLVILAATFIDAKLKIDDPVGAIAVHGVNGLFGVLATGIFANGVYGQGLNGIPHGVTGLLYGDSGQFLAEIIAVAANILWVAPVAALSFFVIGKLVGNRVEAEDEVNGLDLSEMGVHGYSADPGPGTGITPHAYGATATTASVAVVVGR